MKSFKPVKLSKLYLNRIALGLKKEMYESIFKPLFDVMTNKVMNAKQDIKGNWHSEVNGQFINKNDYVNKILADVKPVEINSNDIPIFKSKHRKDLLKYVEEVFKNNRFIQIKDNTRKILLSRNAAKRITSKQNVQDINHNAVYTKIKEIVENAKYFGIIPADERHKNSVECQEIYYSRINIDNEPYNVKISIDVPLPKYKELGASYNYAGHRTAKVKMTPARPKRATLSIDNQYRHTETDVISIIIDFAEDFNPDGSNIVINGNTSALIKALETGRIYYKNGAFRSDKPFSNAVALELEELGAKYKYKAYYIEPAALPIEIENTLAAIAARESAKITAIKALLLKLAANKQSADVEIFIKAAVETMFKKLILDLEQSTKEKEISLVDVSADIPDIEIPDDTLTKIDKYHKLNKEEKENLKIPEVDFDNIKLDKQSEKIVKDYIYNMDYWVKNWKSKNIIKMRKTVLEMIQSGARTAEIKTYFIKQWGVAKRKAEFLARNEAGLASAVLKANHYQNMGCKYFMWIRSTSREKRQLHLEYAKKYDNQYGINGTNIFSFDNPPVIEQIEIKTKSGTKEAVPKPDGEKGLPGQTYNCYCSFAGIYNPEYYTKKRKIENGNIITKIRQRITDSQQRRNNTWRYYRFGQGQKV